MKARALAGLLLITVMLSGCEGAVAYFLLKDDPSSSDGGGGPGSTPPPDPSYRIWIADIASGAAATAEEATLIAAGGEPAVSTWKQVGSGTGTAVFDPTDAPSNFNTILIQANVLQSYNIDGVEVLDLADTVIETANGTTYSNEVTNPGNALGPPQGITALTTATASTRSFFFTRYTQPIEKFRVNIWTTPQSGDIAWTSAWVSAGNEAPAGAAIDPTNGNILVMGINGTASPREFKLVRFTPAGVYIDETSLATGVTGTGLGTGSIAVNAAGQIYVAFMIGIDDDLAVRKYAQALGAPLWQFTFGAASTDYRIEHNGLALERNGDPVVAAGEIQGGGGFDHWSRRLDRSNGSTLWTKLLSPNDPNDTYWCGAAAHPTQDDLYVVGDLTNLANGNIEDITRKMDSSVGDPIWSEQVGDNDIPADRAWAVTIGPSTIVVGGSFGTSGNGKDSILIQYTPLGGLTTIATYNGPEDKDDEILDVAVDPVTGDIYAAGYENVAGQMENMWLRKYTASGSVAWTRTYAGPRNENDRAVKVLLTASSAVLIGFETLMSGETEVLIRAYVK